MASRRQPNGQSDHVPQGPTSHEKGGGLADASPWREDTPNTAGSEVGLQLVPLARANVCPGSLQAPRFVA